MAFGFFFVPFRSLFLDFVSMVVSHTFFLVKNTYFRLIIMIIIINAPAFATTA